ncbi:hypothetical protein RA210_U10550 [Rubrivivax sp. A210]|uniref:lytic transglycosylase domain-containing protein n=1 Tax=Rubrivivax sp. A210 TaxID=2772301 RepID=UPI00191901D1|nr:lytic transglycosylase domain-containing protein [Rubrivivax sp. A210]CAD5366887.1 hypothetical protein RA210_U10550 [Rubrivivax sp. A210]
MAASASAQADCFVHHATRFNLDPALLRAIADVESSFRPEAVNRGHVQRTGTVDVGLMQINTGWLPRLARHGITAADLADPCTSIEIAAWIVSDLVRRHGDTWEAVGAYNAGCSELKGTACTRARSAYAWRVYRRLERSATKVPSSTPGQTVLLAPGLRSLGQSLATDGRDEGAPQ